MPDKIIMPVGFKVPITGGVITVTVAPSGIDWVWRVDELVKGANRVISYKAVPDADEVEFTELVSVNPTTLTAIAEPEPIWYPWAEALAETAGRAEQSAEDSKLAAIESQTSALASKNAAAGSATESYNFMQAAGGHASYAGSSAFSAGTSAATALGHKNDAESAEAGAVAAESNAKLYRDMANISRSAAESAQLASENAKTDTLSARDEAVAAHGATVTTGEVDENGHLILTRTDTTPIDAGYVVGPPINLVISDINTGPAPATVVGPTGPQGLKGDPGGWTTSVIATGTSLDTVTTPGLYLNPNTNAAAGPSNTVGYGGHLEVISSSGWLIQRYTSIFETRKTYIRYRNSSNTWGNWYTYTTNRVDQTAGRVIYQWDATNNRDQLIYGDTGVRNTTELVNPTNFETALSNRTLNLRRNGSAVTLWGQLQVKAGVSVFSYSTCMFIPSGFRPMAGAGVESTALQVRGNTSFLRLLSLGNDFALQTIAGNSLGNMTAGDVVNVNVTYQTSDSWPNSLPGIAVGTVPYQ
jgi:hypothetical protein